MELVDVVSTPPFRIEKAPRNVDIAITGRCNLKCEYCFYADEMISLSDLNTEAWLSYFEELGNASVMRVLLTGGEVFTRRDLFTLIDSIIANRMRYQLLTNGTLITEEVLAKFSEGKRRQRLDSIQVSIDGSTAEIHNANRPKSFERAICGLRLLVKHGFPVTVRITITKNNYRDLENIVELLLDDIGLRRISTNEAMPIGASADDALTQGLDYRPAAQLPVINNLHTIGCQSDNRIVLNAVERLECMQTFIRLEQRYDKRVDSTSGPQRFRQMYADIEHSVRAGKPSASWIMGRLSACGCVNTKLAIAHDGTYTPCHLTPDTNLGNIRTHDLIDVWHKSQGLNNMRRRFEIEMKDLAGCQNCRYNAYCNGGCPGLAQHFEGTVNIASPSFCYKKFRNKLSSSGITDSEVENILFA